MTWLDWSRTRISTGRRLAHQIVGHTPARSVRAAYMSEASTGRWEFVREPIASELRDRTRYMSLNWCLDTGLKSVGVVQGRTFEILWL